MKYPLDQATYVETVGSIIEHEKTQTLLIQKMGDLLGIAIDSSYNENDEPWVKEAETLLKDLQTLRVYHESRRFNEANLRAQNPEKTTPIINALSEEPSEAGEMSEEELAKHFKEKKEGRKQKEKAKRLEEMSLDEIESWEKTQENSNDIYKIKARVANLARGGNMNLTPVGEILCNSYVHVLKALYDFAEKLDDKNVKIQLIQLIRNNEGMPGNIIAAAAAGVKMKKEEKKEEKKDEETSGS
jgi:hypothetical protein